MKDIFKQIIIDFHGSTIPKPSHRDLNLPEFSCELRKAFVFIGMRRSGKTWALYQQMQTLIQQGINIEKILYINFADDRLFDLQAKNLQSILDAYFELYPKYIDDNDVHFFFDEIHEVSNWENFIRRLLDIKKMAIYLSGSSAKMLSKEIATSLRGRAVVREIFPFSFSEYLQYNNVSYKFPLTSDQRSLINHYLKKFLLTGGFPETLALLGHPGPKEDSLLSREFCELLQSYIDGVIYRDIIDRYRIKNPHVIKNLLITCLKNSAKLFSVNKTFNDLKSQGYATSKNSLYKFMSYFEDAYCLFNVPVYDFSSRKSANKGKKIYLIDQGLITAYTIKDSYEDFARLETAVFLHLRRHNKDIYYYQTNNGKEVDLLSVEPNGKISLYQVTLSVNNPETEQREIEALQQAMKELNLETGTIVTMDKEQEITIGQNKIHYVPLSIFLLRTNL
jgi:uncharacterized protein